MSKTFLVTGVNGFVGGHLVQAFTNQGDAVVGVAREQTPSEAVRELLVDYLVADLVEGQLRVPEVDGVVHLAGLSAVGPSFDDPSSYVARNPAMLANVCEPLVERGFPAPVLVVSTGAVYDSHQPMPIAESGSVVPSSPYVVSKLAVEHLAGYYARRGLRVAVARPFNHIGPGQAGGFIVPDLIAATRRALSDGDALRVGDLTTRRDYTDARDVAEAYRLLMHADAHPGTVYNVCSGRSVAGVEILDLILAQLGVTDLEVVPDPERFRPNDPQDISGDASRLRDLTGWSPRIGLAKTIADTVAASHVEVGRSA